MRIAKVMPIIIKRRLSVILVLTIFSSGFAKASDPEKKTAVDRSVNTVVIDAGHGGRDSGAPGKLTLEKHIALNIALKLGQYIEDNIDDVKVIYTRKTDVYIELHERARIANENEADLFISIHVNANTSTRPFGTSTHILGMNQENQNLDVAIRENSVILMEDDYQTTYEGFDPTSTESYIMFSLMQNTYLKQSIEFGSLIQSQFKERAQRKDRGVKRQPLLILREAAMPGVLIETGFISNPNEEKYLMTDEGQSIIASAIFRAFRDYKKTIETRSQFDNSFVLDNEPPAEGAKQVRDVLVGNAEVIQFKIQVASSRTRVETTPENFKGQAHVIVLQDGRWYKYLVGSNTDYQSALDQCLKVKNDYPDAFVVAVKGNEIIPLSDALIEINK